MYVSVVVGNDGDSAIAVSSHQVAIEASHIGQTHHHCEVHEVPEDQISRSELEEDLYLVGSVDFLNVDDSQSDFAHEVADAVEEAREDVRLAYEVSLHSARTRTAVVVVEIAIITGFGRQKNIVSANGRSSHTLASCRDKEEQIGSIANRTSRKSVALEAVGDVAYVAEQVGSVEEVIVCLVAH